VSASVDLEGDGMDQILAELRGRDVEPDLDDAILAQTEELSLSQPRPRERDPVNDWRGDHADKRGSLDTFTDLLTSALSEPVLDDGMASALAAPDAGDDAESFDIDID
jgi:hypothetical protein